MPVRGKAKGQDEALPETMQRCLKCRWASLRAVAGTSAEEVMQGGKLSHMLKGREKVAGFDTAAHTAACPIKCIYKRLYT